jgi:hypothetical protein
MNSVKSAPREGTIVRKLDEFPELLEALREGDLLTARLFCARLFGIDRLERFDAGKVPRAHRRFDHSHES